MDSKFYTVDSVGLSFNVDLKLYSELSLKKCLHRFTNRCSIHLETKGENLVFVRMRPFQDKDIDLDALAGEFMNDLLDQDLREKVALKTEGVRNLIMAHALSNLDLLHPESEEAVASLDPFKIHIPDRQKSNV